MKKDLGEGLDALGGVLVPEALDELGRLGRRARRHPRPDPVLKHLLISTG